MRYTEKIEWLMCDVCNDGVLIVSPQATGWLEIQTNAIGIVADTRKVRHLCHVCREEFDNFWGKG